MSLWILTLIAGYFCLILGLATKSRIIRTSVFLPLSLVCFLRVAFFDSYAQSTPVSRANSSGLAIIAIIRAVDFLLCSRNPHIEFKRYADNDINIGEQTFKRRMKWAATLCSSQRGAGWNWCVSGTPPSASPSTTKRSFIFSSLVRCAIAFLSLKYLPPVFTYIGSRTTLEGPLLLGCMTYSSIYATYEPVCVLWVLLGIGGVEECAPIFGSWSDARSLRGFWGRSWHQSIKRPITSIPNRLLEAFGLGPDRTSISPFLMSGACHAFYVHAMSSGTLYTKTFLFFAVQPIGFFIEKHILQIHRWTPTLTCQSVSKCRPEFWDSDVARTCRNKPDHYWTCWSQAIVPYLGYLWVLTYLALTSRLYSSEMDAT